MRRAYRPYCLMASARLPCARWTTIRLRCALSRRGSVDTAARAVSTARANWPRAANSSASRSRRLQAQVSKVLSLDDHPILTPIGQEVGAAGQAVQVGAPRQDRPVEPGSSRRRDLPQVDGHVSSQRQVVARGQDEGELGSTCPPEHRAEVGHRTLLGGVHRQGACDDGARDRSPAKGEERHQPFHAGRDPHVDPVGPEVETTEHRQCDLPRHTCTPVTPPEPEDRSGHPWPRHVLPGVHRRTRNDPQPESPC